MQKYIRYPKACLTSFDLNFITRKNPFMAAWWSFALPGFGHIYLGAYLKGFLLMAGELIINLKSHLNLGIYYMFLGQFQKSQQSLNLTWVLFYTSIFIFSIFDAWRIAMEINALVELEHMQENRQMGKMKISCLGINALDRRITWYATVWSMIFPGFGQVYNMQYIKALVLMGWFFIIAVMTRLNEAILFTATGKFAKVAGIINYEWLLFLPSIYAYSIWDAQLFARTISWLNREEFLYSFRSGRFHFKRPEKRI